MLISFFSCLNSSVAACPPASADLAFNEQPLNIVVLSAERAVNGVATRIFIGQIPQPRERIRPLRASLCISGLATPTRCGLSRLPCFWRLVYGVEASCTRGREG